MKEKLNGKGHMNQAGDQLMSDVIPLSGLYETWFLDYASYVILERAVPGIGDGLKPVQRRIMHAMKVMDDGRFNKVANIIGSTMQYHPHGDASIGDAMVNMGQKDLLIETQGNWGDLRTGDRAAAPRYIEARLSKFALEILFNSQTTEWQLSYDGRKNEPISLPAKFPLLLAQGVEGIAVGLSTRILPHNFIELIKGSVEILKGRRAKVLPDFPTGGLADFSEYNEGRKGGKVKVRARIEQFDKKSIAVKEIPFGTTTTGLIDSIIKANDKGKIKIRQVVDNTARDVEVLITLAPGQSPDITIDALYAFTDCEVSISPNACVIVDDKPSFLSVSDILKINTEQTAELLNKELEIRKNELLEKILFSSLERIFIENKIYRDIEECETWEAVIEAIDKGLTPYKKQFYRVITEEDIVKLTEIKIKRISRYDTFKADEILKKLEEELKQIIYDLDHITEYAISYFKKLLEKYGKGRERKTEIKSFEDISAAVVAANNVKLFVNRADGFAGYGLKKDEFISECSDIDDILAIRKDGKCMVSRISDKMFMGKDIMHVGVWKKGDERMVYNAVYLDGASGRTMVKRFNVLAVTRDKEYDITKGHPKSRLLYVTPNPNGEAEVITLKLTSGSKARKKVFDFDFSSIEIKGRGAGGNILTKYPVRKIELKTAGLTTLSGLSLWYDDTIGRLNKEKRGKFIGTFIGDDKIISIYNSGSYVLSGYEITNHYEPDKLLFINRFDPSITITAVYYDGASKLYYVKRFTIETLTPNKPFNFITDHSGSKLIVVTTSEKPIIEMELNKGKGKTKEIELLELDEFIDVKGWKAMGNRLTPHKVKKLKLVGESNEPANTPEDSDPPLDQKQTKKDISRPPEQIIEKKQEEVEIEITKKPKDQTATTRIKKDLSPDKSKPIKNKKNDDDKGDTFGIGTTIELDF